jgi:glutamate dehydrogenase
VFDRRSKEVVISPQVREVLSIAEDVNDDMTPAELIRFILKAPVDLLWNAGVGTYVKSSSDPHAEVGDRANDQVRATGQDLRVRVVGEGGNLGFTQLGRIEYAQNGGRINTDFIDNSAGVDTSDHEVNLKILLDLAIHRGELTLEGRNQLLQECANDVVGHVLYDNYLQAQVLSQELVVGVQGIEAYEHLMVQLEEEGELDREVEFMPHTEAMLQRRGDGVGMVRPELAVLLAYAKRSIAAALLDSDIPDSPYLAQDLERYFPPKVVERFGHLLAEHPLRRELIATIAANDVVNSQGVTFVSRMVTETGARPSQVVRAFRIARDVTGAVERWNDVEALDGKIDPATQNQLMSGVDWMVETTARWYIGGGSGQRLAQAVSEARDSFAEFSNVIDQIGPPAWREEHEQLAERLAAEGVPLELARRHSFQGELVHGPDIISVAHATGRSVLEVARGFFLLGERLRIDWLEQRLEEMPAGSRWQRWAQQSMEDDLFNLRRQVVEQVLDHAGIASIDEAVEAFLETHEEAFGRLEKFMRGLGMEGVTDLAQLTVALRQIRSLLG